MNAKVSFDELYRAHYVRVFGLCRRLLNSASRAEDATQETFLRAYRNIASYDQSQPFWPWVATIANRHCIDQLRRRAREPLDFEGEPEAIIAEPPMLDALLQDEAIDAVQAAIAELPDKYRVPLVLAYFNESTYDEIAQLLSISSNHVGVLILRARRMLRERLRPDSQREKIT